MRLYTTIIWLLVFVSPISAQIKLSGQSSPVVISSEISGQVGDFIYVKAVTDQNKPITWQSLDPGLKMLPIDYLKTDTIGVFVAMQPGQYRIIVWQADTRDHPTFAIITVVNGPQPIPVPPNPVPPSPNPVPPNPVIVKALRVVIFYETADLVKYPRSQVSIFTSKDILTYLDGHCAKTTANNITTPDYRIFDKDPATTNIAKVWQDIGKRPRQTIPWLVILDNDVPVLETGLPLTIEETLALLKKYGGS